jgi:enterochelin esterase-like enzyme
MLSRRLTLSALLGQTLLTLMPRTPFAQSIGSRANTSGSSLTPQVRHGRLVRLQGLPWRHVAERPVEVWLPADYDALLAAGTRFAVLYMHDGQMLWDAGTTWNRQAWQVDQPLTRLMRTGAIVPTLVVGIWNAGEWRHSEYFPQKHLQYLDTATRETHLREALRGRAQADAYLRFLVEELKPLIDQRYPTLTDAAHTAIMGSSMGGMISVYALCEYPQIFGRAAGLSTHWVGAHRPNAQLPMAAFRYLQDHLPTPKGHRLYQDHGTTELDALYTPYQPIVDQIARDRGWREGGPEPNYTSRIFEGTGHNENAWAQRLEVPVKFLLGR